jgi:hypothetical protein
MTALTNFQLPHDPLTPLDPNRPPSARTLRILRKELYANAAAVPSTRGGGAFGHLGMIMPTQDYEAISGGVAFVDPTVPTVPNYQGAGAVVAGDRDKYLKRVEVYNTWRDLSNQLKKQIIEAVPSIYLSELEDPTLGFATVTPRAILTHLVTNYGQISHKDLEENHTQLQAKWDPDTPIESVFVNGNFCRELAKEGGDPISDTMYVVMLAKTFKESGVLDDAVKEWNRKPMADKSLNNVTKHFKEANTARLAEESGATKNVLQAHVGTHVQPKARHDAQPTTKPSGMEGMCYCWTHGICKHNGYDCTSPRQGHIQDATWLSRRGGSTKLQGAGKPQSQQRSQAGAESTTPTNN